MIIDQMILNVPREHVLQSLTDVLARARKAKPFPHLAYRHGYSFMDQMKVCNIEPHELQIEWHELVDLERMGAGLFIRHAMKQLTIEDPLIEDIHTLVGCMRRAMRRYNLSPDIFGIEEAALVLCVRTYWIAHGTFFGMLLRESLQNPKTTTEARVFFLHEIRLAKKMGGLTCDDLGCEPDVHTQAIECIAQELDSLIHHIRFPDLSPVAARLLEQRYNLLVTVSRKDLRDAQTDHLTLI